MTRSKGKIQQHRNKNSMVLWDPIFIQSVIFYNNQALGGFQPAKPRWDCRVKSSPEDLNVLHHSLLSGMCAMQSETDTSSVQLLKVFYVFYSHIHLYFLYPFDDLMKEIFEA